jgi:hypothetical protein
MVNLKIIIYLIQKIKLKTQNNEQFRNNIPGIKA